MSDDIRLPDDPEPFRQWLLARGNAPAGERKACMACPLHWHLISLGADNALIATRHYAVLAVGQKGTYPLPRWAELFVHRYDREERDLTCREAAALLPEPKL